MLKKLTALLISTVMLLSTFISAIPVGAAENENLLAGLTYTMSMGEENFHSSHQDLTYSKLTDGLRASSWGNAESVGFYTKEKTATFSITFDLPEPIAFKEIVMGFFGGEAGIEYPATLVVERKISTGNSWETIYSGGVFKDYGYADTVLASEESIYAYALRLTITGGFVWTFLDEVQLFAETSGMPFGTLGAAQKVIAPKVEKNLEEHKYIEAGDSYTMEVEAVSPDGGEISYQWYKENTPIGENSPAYTIENATSADAGSYRVEITNSLGRYSYSEFSKTCSLLVGDDSTPAFAPVINKDIASNYFLTAGDSFTLEMEAQSVDGGEISYQWYKDGVKIEGETSSKLKLNPVKLADEGVYEAEAINTKNGTKASVFSNDCVITVKKEPENLISGKKYETTVTADGYHSNGRDDERTKLTDGVTTSSWGGGLALGVNTKGANTTYNLDFALGNAIEFQQINMGFIGNTAGINLPSNVKVFIKNEDNTDWFEIYNGQPKSAEVRYEFPLGAEKAIKATDIRFTITGSGSWSFVDEIMVYDIRTGEKVAGDLIVPPSSDNEGGEGGEGGGSELPPAPEGNNLALGKPYTPSKPAHDLYPDVDGKELTDGVFANSTSYGDTPAWAGFNGGMYSTANIVFDLESVQSFKEVRFNILSSTGGIGVPNKLNVEISNDGATWTKMMPDDLGYSVVVDLGEEQEFQRVTAGFLSASTTVTPMGIYDYISAVPDAVSARYVRISWTFQASWVFIDEVQINKEVTARVKNTPAEITERVSDPDPENIAFGKSYEVNSDFASFYPDNGIKLTDGRHGTGSIDSTEWVAYNAPEGSGGYQSVDKASSKYPTSIKVEYSSDGQNWKFFTDSDLTELQSAPVGTRRFDYGQPFTSKGRYVKVTVYGTDFVALDEIEIYKSFDGTLDDEITDDAKLSYNLSANYGATPSRPADSGDADSMLTDGIYGQWVKYDSKGNSADDHIILSFDLTDLNSIEKIDFHTRSGSGVPQNVLFKVSTDGQNWATVKDFFTYTSADENGRGVSFVWDGDKDPFYTYAENADAIYARFVRAEFDVPKGKTVAVDEMTITGKRGRTSTSAVAINKPGEEYNLALGKPYERSGFVTPDYPDTNGTEITDGIHGTNNYMDPAWVGHNYRYYGPTNESKYAEEYKFYSVDLGELKTITSVRATFLGAIGNGFNTPKYIDTLVSVDGYNWMKLTNNDTASKWPGGIIEYGWHINGNDGVNVDMTDGAEMVVARYVKVFWELTTTTMIDEIEVMGYDGVKTGDGIMSAEEVAARATPHENGGDYHTPDQTGGIHDLLLCYNGWYGTAEDNTLRRGEWNAHRFKPMLTYIDENGDSVDTLYDAVLFLALNARSGHGHGWRTSWVADDVIYWYHQMFDEGGDIDELNKAALQVREDLNLPDYKVKLVISFPQVWHDDAQKPKYFGKLGDRDIVDIGDPDNFDYYTQWWIDEVQKGLEKGNWEAVEFTGYYWTHEGIGGNTNHNDPNDGKYTNDIDSNDEGIMRTAELIEEAEERWDKEFLFYWIPYKSAEGNFHARKNNIDVWSVQTGNYFVRDYNLTEYGGYGNPGTCTTVASMTSYLNASMEFEFDAGVIKYPWKYNLFLDYLNAAIEYDMTGRDVYRSWYQGVDDIYAIAYSRMKDARNLYNAIYGVISGTATEQLPYITDFSSEEIEGDLGEPYASGSAAGGAPGGTAGGSGSSGGAYYDEVAKPVIGEPVSPEAAEKPSYEGYGWVEENGTYRYENTDGDYATGWVDVNNTWYYFDTEGDMETGWIRHGNRWYYLKDNGAMATGWLKDNGKWYYLFDWGGMANNEWVYDNGWYYTRGNGEMLTGWLQEGDSWYYLKSNGLMAKDWNLIDGNWYFFYDSGRMAANEIVNGYKVNADGVWVK